MKRRFNYTGRGRIPREKVVINLSKKDKEIESFKATIGIDDLKLPPQAKVYVEAYHKTELKRFDFGTVGQIMPPVDMGLSSLEYRENLKFRVLIVDESGKHGRIIADADKIKADADTNKKAILPIEFRDLGQQIWQVDYADDECPILLVNKNIPNIENIAKSEPSFIMYVYPAVIREILSHMIFVEGVDSVDEPSEDWHNDWLDFANRVLLVEEMPSSLDPEGDDFDDSEAISWINRVVEEFCISREEWNLYINLLLGESKP